MPFAQTRRATRTIPLAVALAVALVTPASRAAAAPEPEPTAATARPRPLKPLYIAYAALQLIDLESTHRALEAGGREANPIVGATGGHRGGMLAIKAAATAATILGTERLWKTNPTAAVVLMAAINTGYVMIAAHNLRAGARR